MALLVNPWAIFQNRQSIYKHTYLFLKKVNNYVTFDILQASTIVCLPNYNAKRPPNTEIQ